MKTNLLKYALLALPLSLFATGCSTGEEPGASLSSRNSIEVRFELPMADIALRKMQAGRSSDDAIGTVKGYRFEDGLLREIATGAESSADGDLIFHLAARKGTMYFVANPPAGAFDALQPESSTLDEFLATAAATAAMTADGLTMTGHATLSETGSATIAVTLTRSVARLDLASPDAGVEVHSVVLRNIADRGYVHPQQGLSTPQSADRGEFRKEYGQNPLSNGSETLLYLAEQNNSQFTAEIVARFGGGWHRTETMLPAEILRNTSYKLVVHGKGAELNVTIEADGWQAGDSTDSEPDLKGLIDLEASELPKGVSVNNLCDTVRITHAENRFRLVLKAEAGSEVQVEGSIDRVTVTPQLLTRGLMQVAVVSIEKPLFMPGRKEEYICLDLMRDNLRSGRIVLIFEESPIKMTGLLAFDDNGLCDFGKYIDGELAVIGLPSGTDARLEFDESEDPWMKLESTEEGLRLLGGWKPNDPKADGRPQEGHLVVEFNDGTPTESYTIRRVNWGLPVVEIGRNWWCKYNLRGNVKHFEEQVQIKDDPATEEQQADFLATCDDDVLLSLMGDQYQGGNPDGLPLRHDGNLFYYEGMQSTGGNFGTLPPDEMAPDGYRIPEYEDYKFFSASDNFNLGGIGERPFWNSTQDRVWVRIIERDAEFLGASYGNVTIYEFTDGATHWVLYGLGHQWSTAHGDIARKNLLLATWGNSGRTWGMEGYAQSDRANQNWIKFSDQNSTKTRIIRCIKTPVEYIYE